MSAVIPDHTSEEAPATTVEKKGSSTLSIVLALLYAVTGIAVIAVAFSYQVMYVPDVIFAIVMVVGAVKLERSSAGPLTHALLLVASGAAIYGGGWHLTLEVDDSLFPVTGYRQLLGLIDQVCGIYLIPFGVVSLALLMRSGNGGVVAAGTSAAEAGDAPDQKTLLQALGLVNVFFGLIFVLLAWGKRSVTDDILVAAMIAGGTLLWSLPRNKIVRSLVLVVTGGILYLGLLNMTSEALRNSLVMSRFISLPHILVGGFLTAFGLLAFFILRKPIVDFPTVTKGSTK